MQVLEEEIAEQVSLKRFLLANSLGLHLKITSPRLLRCFALFLGIDTTLLLCFVVAFALNLFVPTFWLLTAIIDTVNTCFILLLLTFEFAFVGGIVVDLVLPWHPILLLLLTRRLTIKNASETNLFGTYLIVESFLFASQAIKLPIKSLTPSILLLIRLWTIATTFDNFMFLGKLTLSSIKEIVKFQLTDSYLDVCVYNDFFVASSTFSACRLSAYNRLICDCRERIWSSFTMPPFVREDIRTNDYYSFEAMIFSLSVLSSNLL